MTDTQQTNDEFQKLSEEASEIAKKNIDIQAEVYRITVDALTHAKLEPARVKKVMEAVLEGFQSGAQQNKAPLDDAFRKAVNGLDEAMAAAVIATKLAIQEASSKAGEYTDQEIKKSLHQLGDLENQFLDTLHSIATTSAESTRQILTDLVEHTRNSGTAVGERSTEALSELGNLVEKFGKAGLDMSTEFARVTGNSILSIASGFLSGVGDSLKKAGSNIHDRPK